MLLASLALVTIHSLSLILASGSPAADDIDKLLASSTISTLEVEKGSVGAGCGTTGGGGGRGGGEGSSRKRRKAPGGETVRI